MAVLSALLATVLLTALGVGIALLGAEESMLASHERMARSLRQASLAGVQLALADLRSMTSWDPILAAGSDPHVSAVPSRLVADSLLPSAPWNGAPIDLGALTDRLQAASDAARGPGEGPQVWRLLVYERFGRVAPAAGAAPWYIAVWVADDGADTDGDPLRDTNGILAMRAAAFGPGDAMSVTDVSVGRTADSGGVERVRALTVRPGS